MRLVDDAKSAWKWFSMWAMGTPAAAIGTWLILPDDLRSYVLTNVPPWAMLTAIAAILLLGMWGRVVDQGTKA